MANDLSRIDKPIPFGAYTKDHLNKAMMAAFLWSPTSEEATRFVAELSRLTIEYEALVEPRKRKRKAEDQRSFDRSIAAFAADLIRHSRNTDSLGFLYRAANREALGNTLVSSDSFEKLSTWWPAMGLVETTGFIQAKHTLEGERLNSDYYTRARRFRARPSLLLLAEGFGIAPETILKHFQKEVGLLRPVVIRDESYTPNGKRSEPKEVRIPGPRYDAEAQRVLRLNDILANSGFDLEEAPRVFRLFNRGDWLGFDFNMGGRLYSWSEDDWQQMPQKTRAKITCYGEPTVEIDVQASHFFILYALNGQTLSPNEDPYDIPGIERDVVKGVFAAITGMGKLPNRWPRKLCKSYKEETGKELPRMHKLKDVKEALLERHPVLESICKGTLDWAHLQYEESECFLAAMTELGEHFEVGALPVHDSLLVAKRHQVLAIDILGQAYERRFGSRPYIRVK